MLVILRVVRITVRGKYSIKKNIFPPKADEKNIIRLMIRNTTYLLLTKVFGGVWEGPKPP